MIRHDDTEIAVDQHEPHAGHGFGAHNAEAGPSRKPRDLVPTGHQLPRPCWPCRPRRRSRPRPGWSKFHHPRARPPFDMAAREPARARPAAPRGPPGTADQRRPPPRAGPRLPYWAGRVRRAVQRVGDLRERQARTRRAARNAHSFVPAATGPSTMSAAIRNPVVADHRRSSGSLTRLPRQRRDQRFRQPVPDITFPLAPSPSGKPVQDTTAPPTGGQPSPRRSRMAARSAGASPASRKPRLLHRVLGVGERGRQPICHPRIRWDQVRG